MLICSALLAAKAVANSTMTVRQLDIALNERVAALKPSKTMALTDLASSLREKGKDVIGLAAGEPDFDTPGQILDAGIEALRLAKSMAWSCVFLCMQMQNK